MPVRSIVPSVVVLACVLCCAWGVAAPAGETGALQQPILDGIAAGAPVSLRLDNGAVVEGIFRGRDGDVIEVDHETLGRLRIPVRRLWAAPAAQGDAETEPDAETVTQAPVPLWERQVEFGLNGSEGNSPRMNIRGALALKRESAGHRTDLSLLYTRAEDDSRLSESKLLADAKHDWKFAATPWSVFALAGLEFNEFTDFDVRINAAVGPGYRFVDNATTVLVGRLGFGGSREFGGANTQFAPEAVAGLDFDHKISERQKFTAGVDVFPDLRAAGQYRANGKAAWEIAVNEGPDVNLKLGIEDRYDSTPEGAKKNDFDYLVSLVWRF